MEFTGEFTTRLPRERAYAFLTDPAVFSRALPDVEDVQVLDPASFTTRVRLGISYIRGVFSVRFHRVAATEGRAATYVGKGLGLGSSAEVEASFELEDVDTGGSRVRWSGKARLFGRISGLGGGLLEPIGRKNAARFIESLRQGLEATAGGVSGEAP